MLIYREDFFVNRTVNCFCGEIENLPHIYSCEHLNNTEIQYPYNRVFNGTLTEQLYILNRMKYNLKQRENKLK